MPGPQTYVNIEKMVVKDVFDQKYKTSLPGIMQKAAEAAVKLSKQLTLDKPKDKSTKGYTLDGSMVTLGPDKDGKKLHGECSMVISTWPGKSVKAMPSGKADMPIDDPQKITSGDVEALATAVVEGAMKEATKYMDKNAPS